MVNSSTAGVNSVESAVSALANGNFAVAWYQSDPVLGSSHQIQIFTGAGDRVGDQITVQNHFSGTQVGPKLVGLLDGGFALAWTANAAPYSDGVGKGVFVQAFDSGGQPHGDPVLVNGQTDGDQFDPALVGLKGGGYAVSWTDLNGAGGDDDQVMARIFLAQQPITIVSDGGGDSTTLVVGENQLGATEVTAVAGGSSAGVSYAIDGGDDAARFTIDAATGALGFVTAPDFEAPTGDGDNLYRVDVRASNAFSTDIQAITVRVADVNEAPRIASDGGGTSAALSLPENGTPVTTVRASDPEGSTARYAITGGPDAARFAIDPDTGAVTFVRAPDFEAPEDFAADNFYKVIVSASDGALASDQALEIFITNVNEGLAITSAGGGASAAVTVQENGLAATSVTATDLDGDTLFYSIAGGADAGRFAIDPDTGALVFLAAPNFEAPADGGADNLYDVVVRASDGAFSDTQALAITVTNLNEAPVITSNGGGDIASISVTENGTGATTVSSADPEGGSRTYAIIGGADAARFNLNPTIGALSFVAAPDFEAPTDADRDNVYDVTVTVTDGLLSDSQKLTVTVGDVAEPVNIVGTASNDLISTTRSVAGHPFATPYNDRIEGRGGNDTLSGGDGADAIDGGSGADRLVGEGGADVLTGGSGADIFDYGALFDSRPGAADVIIDFSRQQDDRISLARIDARVATSTDDAFKFIGAKAFSKEAGQLRFEQVGANTRVLGDVDGDGVADFQIDVLGAVKFVANDFLF